MVGTIELWQFKENMMRVRVFASAYNNQSEIEISDEDYKKLQQMSIDEKEDWFFNSQHDVLVCHNIVNIEVTECINSMTGEKNG